MVNHLLDTTGVGCKRMPYMKYMILSHVMDLLDFNHTRMET